MIGERREASCGAEPREAVAVRDARSTLSASTRRPRAGGPPSRPRGGGFAALCGAAEAEDPYSWRCARRRCQCWPTPSRSRSSTRGRHPELSALDALESTGGDRHRHPRYRKQRRFSARVFYRGRVAWRSNQIHLSLFLPKIRRDWQPRGSGQPRKPTAPLLALPAWEEGSTQLCDPRLRPRPRWPLVAPGSQDPR